MSFTVRSLILHHDIVLPATGPAPDGTTAIYEYRSRVAANDLEPDPADHLRDRRKISVIPAGTYLFTQGTVEWGSCADEQDKPFQEAVEAVWLESLWREQPLKNDRILVRILMEDSHMIFQIFREI